MKLIFTTLFAFVIICTVAQAQSKSFNDYVGVYKFPDGSVITQVEVVMQDSVTLIMKSSQGDSPLAWDKNDDFSITGFNGTATFKRNDSTKVVGVHIEAMGYVLDGTKEVANTAPKNISWAETMSKQKMFVEYAACKHPALQQQYKAAYQLITKN
jgi:hypothetical protein